MFATSVNINDAAAAAKTFTKVSNDVDEANFLDSSTTLSAPRALSIKHTMAKSGNVSGVDRHLVSFQHTVLDAANKPITATVNVTLAVPRATITRTNVDDLIAFAKNFFTTSNTTSLLNGEV